MRNDKALGKPPAAHPRIFPSMGAVIRQFGAHNGSEPISPSEALTTGILRAILWFV
jgi:hypothetical protein